MIQLVENGSSKLLMLTKVQVIEIVKLGHLLWHESCPKYLSADHEMTAPKAGLV